MHKKKNNNKVCGTQEDDGYKRLFEMAWIVGSYYRPTCKISGIECLNRNVTMDNWFENMRCDELHIEESGFHELGMLYTCK